MKGLLPPSLRQLFRNLWWFRAHYREISGGGRLAPPGSTVIEAGNFYGPVTYAADNLVTANNCDFIREPRFARAYRAAAETNPWPGFTLQWRVYTVCWFADLARTREGDFVECGVNTGAYARAIIEYIDFPSLPKRFYLLDTFAGLVPEQITAEEKAAGIAAAYVGNYRDVYPEVQRTFAPFNVRLIRGPVPDTLPQADAEKICYLSLDMNVAAPELAALNHFWDRMVPGGVVMLDDYGFSRHINQKLAFDRFARDKGLTILSLPTGQGVILKP
jgi:O-methyltransferase